MGGCGRGGRGGPAAARRGSPAPPAAILLSPAPLFTPPSPPPLLPSRQGNLSKFVQQRPEAAAYYNLADATTKWVLPEPGFLEVRRQAAGGQSAARVLLRLEVCWSPAQGAALHARRRAAPPCRRRRLAHPSRRRRLAHPSPRPHLSFRRA